MEQDPNISPVNPLPPVIVALALAFAVIEIAVTLGSKGLIGGPQAVGWRIALVSDYAPSGFLLDRMIETHTYTPDLLLRFVTYPFIHANFTHMVFSVVILLAMGKVVGEVFKGWAVLVVFFASSIGAALIYGLVISSRVALIGAMPGVYGLIGAFTFVLWMSLGLHNANRMRAFSLIGFLMGIQLVFGVLFGSTQDWIADLSGFAIGFLLSFVVSPGGWARVLDTLRQRS